MYTIIGGRLSRPLDLEIKGDLPVPAEKVFANAAQVKSRGLKTYRSWQAKSHRLAVVGGGPSIKKHRRAIKNFDGDVWAINGAYGWCKERNIDATFFCCDPHPVVAQWAKHATRALLEQSCDLSVFDALKEADVYTFDTDPENGGIAGCASTASCAPHLAIRMGYRSVTFFGCESSFEERSHAYMNEERHEQMLFLVDGGQHLTAPDLFLQAIGLSEYIREVPEFLSEQSGGLLRAMVNDPYPHLQWVSDGMAESFGQTNRGPQVSPAYQPKTVSGAVAMADNLEAFGLTEKDVAA